MDTQVWRSASLALAPLAPLARCVPASWRGGCSGPWCRWLGTAPCQGGRSGPRPNKLAREVRRDQPPPAGSQQGRSPAHCSRGSPGTASPWCDGGHHKDTSICLPWGETYIYLPPSIPAVFSEESTKTLCWRFLPTVLLLTVGRARCGHGCLSSCVSGGAHLDALHPAAHPLALPSPTPHRENTTTRVALHHQ